MASTSTKRKHKTLALQDKWDIIKRSESGETATAISRLYDIGRATVYDILKSKEKIEEFINSLDDKPRGRKTLKMSDYPEVEKALYIWIKQQQGIAITGDMLKTQAQIIYSEITNKDDFRASDGWLENFKKRHGFRFSKLEGDRLNEGHGEFITNLNAKISEMSLIPEQIYKATEIHLHWRKHSKYNAEGKKFSHRNKNFTLDACANAFGTHKLKLLAVTESEIYLKNDETLPVALVNRNRGCVTNEIYLEWCKNHFVPQIEEELKKNGLPLKALILLENRPGQTNKTELKIKTKDGYIETMHIPKNISIDQNIMKTLTAYYKKRILSEIVHQAESSFLQTFNISAAIINASFAWDQIQPQTLISSWRNIWPENPLLYEVTKEPSDELQQVLNEALEICQTAVPESIESFRTWLLDDNLYIDLVDREEKIKNMDQHQKKYLTKSKEVQAAASILIRWCKDRAYDTDKITWLKQIQEELKADRLKIKNKDDEMRGKYVPEPSSNLANLPNLTHISNLAHLSNLANITKYANNISNIEDEDDSRSHSPILSIAYPEVCMKDVSSDEDAGSYNSLDGNSATNNHSSISTEGEIRGRRGTHGSEDSQGPLALGLDLDEAAAARMLAALKSIDDPVMRHRFRQKIHMLSEECELASLQNHREMRKEI